MLSIRRRKTRVVQIGTVPIGQGHPVAIQSMAKTKTSDISATVAQILRLERVGCQIIRVAVKDERDSSAIASIRKAIHIPLVADIHFHWKLAMKAIESGADKIRLNPGNINRKNEIREIVRAAQDRGIPIRVGVNSGSVIRKGKGSSAQIMVQAALRYIGVMEGFGFHDIVVSLKGSSLFDTLEAYRRMAKLCHYPFHIGVTATGLPDEGIVTSSIATGALLLEGIGDTIRISLTDRPEAEVKVAQNILSALGLFKKSVQIISCPTCGRCEVDLIRIVKELERKLQTADYGLRTPLKVAVMGCVVNGPGEAREADIGIAFGRGQGMLFKAGRQCKKIPYSQCVEALVKEIAQNG